MSINILTTATYDLGSPIDCKWTEFSLWSECSQSCGGGVQSRERTIEILARNGGQPCRGETREKRQCNTHKCPRTLFILSQIDFRISTMTSIYLSIIITTLLYVIVATFRAQDLIFLPFYQYISNSRNCSSASSQNVLMTTLSGQSKPLFMF